MYKQVISLKREDHQPKVKKIEVVTETLNGIKLTKTEKNIIEDYIQLDRTLLMKTEEELTGKQF